MEIKINRLEDINSAAKTFIKELKDNKVIAFYGNMGAGKTTFIKAVCEELGVEEVINSPTFAIVNEYTTIDNEIIYHFDFYRINSTREAQNFGAEEYFYSGNLCFIEWPQIIEELLPEDTIKVNIEINEDNSRIIYW